MGSLLVPAGYFSISGVGRVDCWRLRVSADAPLCFFTCAGHDPPLHGRPSVPRSGRPSARQLLARLDARPLAARAANDVATLVRRAGTTLRLRPKESE